MNKQKEYLINTDDMRERGVTYRLHFCYNCDLWLVGDLDVQRGVMKDVAHTQRERQKDNGDDDDDDQDDSFGQRYLVQLLQRDEDM